MSGILQSMSSIGGAAAPSIPDLTGLLHLYSTYGITVDFQNDQALIRDGDNTSIASTAVAPYPLDWVAIGTPLLARWNDQAGGIAGNGVGHEPQINVGAQTFTYSGGTQYLAAEPLNVVSMDKLTMYCVFKTNTLAAAQTLFQYSYASNYVTVGQNLFAAYLTATGVLTVTQKMDDTVDVFNTQIKTLGNTNLHLLTVVFDRTVAAANQTLAKIDNSTSGWSSSVAGDMASSLFHASQALGLGLGQPLGVDAFLDGVMLEYSLFSGAHGAGTQTEWYNYYKYLHPSIG